MLLMHLLLILQAMVLLALANGTPVFAKKIFGQFLAFPLDGGLLFFDGRPLFGPSKTVRGIVLSVLVTAAGAPLIGLDWSVGALAAAAAMAGDLCSSFCKRCVVTSRPKAPVATCHSQTALPRSSNFTRPVDFASVALFNGASAGPFGPALTEGFGFSLLTLPF